jgi:hypothetical protein
MKKAEIIITLLSIITLSLNILLIPEGGTSAILSLSLLAMIYFYFSFAFFNNIKFRKIFKKESYKDISTLRIVGAICTGMALSAILSGVLFYFQSWPGAMMDFIMGFGPIIVILTICIIKYFKNKSSYYIVILRHSLIVGGISLIIILTPRMTWINMRYENHPGYRSALEKAIANPSNQELWKKVDAEREKMYQDE